MHGSRPRVSYNVIKMSQDMANKSWMAKDLAFHAKVSHMTVSRFLRRERQTAKTAGKLAAALGYAPKRYVVSAKSVAA